MEENDVWKEILSEREREVTIFTERTIEEVFENGKIIVSWLRQFPENFFISLYMDGHTAKIPISEIDKIISCLEQIRTKYKDLP